MPARLDYDQIAAWIHGYYQQANPETVYKAFDELPEFLKVDNRDAAIRIGRRVLAMAGLRLEPRNTPEWAETEQVVIRQIVEDSLPILARAEHGGWVESRLRNGWTLADCKDIDRREHHLLVPYERFPDQITRKQAKAGAARKKDGTAMSVDEEVQHEKRKDLESVRKYVDIIARTAYKIVREA